MKQNTAKSAHDYVGRVDRRATITFEHGGRANMVKDGRDDIQNTRRRAHKARKTRAACMYIFKGPNEATISEGVHGENTSRRR